MGMIGGIVDWGNRPLESRRLFAMSRSMILQGSCEQKAYIHGGCGLFQHTASYEHNDRRALPLTLQRNQKLYTLLLDGAVQGCGPLEGLGSEFCGNENDEWILHAYLSFGTELPRFLQGSFALAVLDEHRGELFLARNSLGASPLFYAEEDHSLLFSSEIKGILHALPSVARIDVGALRAHLISPCGAFNGGALYRDIASLPSGSGRLFTPLGLTKFSWEPPETVDSSSDRGELPSTYYPDVDETSRMLGEILYAFDYPQFDHWMPSFLHHLEQAHSLGRHHLTIYDPSLCVDLQYAAERADRLGGLTDCSVKILPPPSPTTREKDLRKYERVLRELLNSSDTHVLRQLFGVRWSDSIPEEKNTAKRIRRLGMLYQTILWVERYPLLLQ